jgi:hypothetical protein
MVLEDMAATAKPETILGWYRKLIANKFDGSKFRRRVGCPKLDQETERLGQRPPSPRHFSSAEAQAIDLMEELYPLTPGRFGGHGLFHDGSANAQRVDDLLCAVLHPLGDSPSDTGRIHAVPGSGVDGAAGAKHDDGGVGKPEGLPLSAARPRCEVPPIISGTDQDGKCESASIAGKKPYLNDFETKGFLAHCSLAHFCFKCRSWTTWNRPHGEMLTASSFPVRSDSQGQNSGAVLELDDHDKRSHGRIRLEAGAFAIHLLATKSCSSWISRPEASDSAAPRTTRKAPTSK